MRISDWSSDVCSSDLVPSRCREGTGAWSTSRRQRQYGAQARLFLTRSADAGLTSRTSFSPSSMSARCKGSNRSEEHTSELQSLMRISYAVFCLKTTKQHKHHK